MNFYTSIVYFNFFSILVSLKGELNYFTLFVFHSIHFPLPFLVSIHIQGLDTMSPHYVLVFRLHDMPSLDKHFWFYAVDTLPKTNLTKRHLLGIFPYYEYTLQWMPPLQQHPLHLLSWPHVLR